mmetsp:Transcript_72872/g.126509  ORF Transcript_72872/g.126509 Transcript_72872/m.126509 type:complete len:243 (+) Transcript_72872:189-917(+)
MILYTGTFLHAALCALVTVRAAAAATGRELRLRHEPERRRADDARFSGPPARVPASRASAAVAAVLDAPVQALLAKPHAALVACCGLGGPSDDGGNFRNPKVWGPPTWFFLHSMTLSLPKEVPAERQLALKAIMDNLPQVLPCPPCGQNLAKHMEKNPIEPHLGTRESLVRWMVDLHNMVNREIGKRELTRDEALREFTAAYKSGRSHGYLAVIGESGAAPGTGRRSFALLMTFAAVLAVLM